MVDEVNANSTQVGGSHYQGDAERAKRMNVALKILRGETLQHWDIVYIMGWDYFQGQVTRYVDRYRKKSGAQDLAKARHVIDKMLELLAGEGAVEEELAAALAAAEVAAQRPSRSARSRKVVAE